MGGVLSKALQFTLAGVPPKPTPAPSVISSGTTTSTIKVSFESTNVDTGGSPITLYELQMDDGNQGNFSTVFTSAHYTEASVSEGVSRGKYYRFRYRVHNVAGASPWSDVTYIQAIEAPAIPSAPTFTSATDTSITVGIVSSTDSRGVDVTGYELYIDAGDNL